MNDELVVAKTYYDSHEAEIAKGKLLANNIFSETRSDSFGRQRLHLDQTSGVGVLVKAADLEIAKEILNDVQTVVEGQDKKALNSPKESTSESSLYRQLVGSVFLSYLIIPLFPAIYGVYLYLNAPVAIRRSMHWSKYFLLGLQILNVGIVFYVGFQIWHAKL